MKGKESGRARPSRPSAETQAKKAKLEETEASRKEFGKIVQRLRVARGLTQRELAQAVEQDYYTLISHVETGRVRIPPRDLTLWASALGVSVHALAKEAIRAYEPQSLFEAIYPAGQRGSDL